MSALWRWLKRLLLGLVLLIVAVLLVGMGYEQWSRFRLPQTNPRPGELFAVGESSLHLNCRGTGDPTVILESGLTGFGSTHWFAVQPEVEQFTRVCSYDRAGIMWSESISGPRTGARMVGELHALLAAAEIPPPYVMVGHSLGGALVRMYDDRFPGEVTGFVFVDSPQPDQQERLPPGAVGGEPPPTWVLSVFTATGLVRLMPATQSTLIPSDVAKAAQAYSPRSVHGMFAEIRAINETVIEAKNLDSSPGSLDSRPTVVLSRDVFDADPEGTRAVWMEMQDEIALLSSNSDHRVIDGTTHNIHIDSPEAVVVAIQDVVSAVRSNLPIASNSE
jgi:pimeloyl-ACP methyl ester carboxylesterase